MDTNLYTNKIKQEAISKILGSLFVGTCEYSDLILDRWNKPIEPDINALNQFRTYLNELATLTRVQDFSALKACIENIVIPFINKTGSIYGHITSSYVIGTWGVRYSTIKDILTVIAIENIPYWYNKTGKIYELDVKITFITVSTYALWLELSPINPEVNKFQIDFNWATLKNNDYKNLTINEEVINE
jgi:hypothetical protein